MIKLRGETAEARLADAWKEILSRDPAGQEIIHVLAQPAVQPGWIAEFPVFQTWSRNGCGESDEVWGAFTEIARSWPYIVNARQAAMIGIPNVRVFVLDDSQVGPNMPEWLRYLTEVHLPAISAMSGETLYKLQARDFLLKAGIRVRDHDVNLFGTAGVMIAGGDNGDVEWRAFLDETNDPELFREEYEHVTAVRDFVVGHGTPVRLPAVGQP